MCRNLIVIIVVENVHDLIYVDSKGDEWLYGVNLTELVLKRQLLASVAGDKADEFKIIKTKKGTKAVF